MNGFKNPSTGFPAATSLSLMSAIMFAKVGEDAEVPLTRPVEPSATISKFRPWVETYTSKEFSFRRSSVQKNDGCSRLGNHGQYY